MHTPTNSPASRIIGRFGGISRCARALAKPKSSVQRWKDSGFIHPDYYPAILDAAVSEGVVLDVRDFNIVDVDHPAFNVGSTQVSDDTADRAGASFPDPKSQISESPQPVHGSDARSIVAASEGAA